MYAKPTGGVINTLNVAKDTNMRKCYARIFEVTFAQNVKVKITLQFEQDFPTCYLFFPKSDITAFLLSPPDSILYPFSNSPSFPPHSVPNWRVCSKMVQIELILAQKKIDEDNWKLGKHLEVF